MAASHNAPRVSMGSQPTEQLRVAFDSVQIDNVPLRTEIDRLYEELYRELPGAPHQSVFIAKLIKRGIEGVREDAARKGKRRRA